MQKYQVCCIWEIVSESAYFFPCDKLREILLDPAKVFWSCSIWVRREFAHSARDALVAAFQPITGGIYLAPFTFLVKITQQNLRKHEPSSQTLWCGLGSEWDMSWEGSMGVDSKAEANAVAVLHRSFTLRPAWPCVSWLPVPPLCCTQLHVLCGDTLILQANLKTFCGEQKVRLKDRKQMLASTELLSSRLCQGNLGDISFFRNVIFLLQSKLGQILIFLGFP